MGFGDDSSDVVHVEVTPGVVIVVAAWMLDRAACAGMSLGAPRVKLAALAELHQLLVHLQSRARFQTKLPGRYDHRLRGAT